MNVSIQQTPVSPSSGKFNKDAYDLPHSQALFEWPTEAFTKRFEALLPIMARLPTGVDKPEEEVDLTVTYLQPRQDVDLEGTLPYESANEGLTYTLSHLPVIDDPSRALWTALHKLRPLSNDYAGDKQISSLRPPTQHPRDKADPIQKCPFALSNPVSAISALTLVRTLFNWPDLHLPACTSGKFYGVVFRSKRAPGSESTNLYLADKLAHEEAVGSGGLLMYFYGAPDPDTGVNLATCIWSSRDDAKRASRLPMHRLAVEHARKAYAWFELERYAVVKRWGEEGVRIEAWVD